MASDQKVYMPLMIGDWLKGTRGMKAEVRGVYLNLLLFQWDNGYIPSDMETLSLIDPEIGKVWVFIKDKFVEDGPGRLKNLKNNEVRDFWKKQSSNGKKGGRPKKVKPGVNPNNNPKRNLHNNDSDLDIGNELSNKEGVDFSDYEKWTSDVVSGNDWMFADKIRNMNILVNGRIAEFALSYLSLLAQYPNKKPPDQNRFRISLIAHIQEKLKDNGKQQSTLDKGTAHTVGLMESYKQHYGGTSGGG